MLVFVHYWSQLIFLKSALYLELSCTVWKSGVLLEGCCTVVSYTVGS